MKFVTIALFKLLFDQSIVNFVKDALLNMITIVLGLIIAYYI